jgi:uncharacterized protein YraI
MLNRRILVLSIVSILIFACNFPTVSAVVVNPTETSSPLTPSVNAPVVTPSAAPSTSAVPPSPSVPVASPNGQPLNCRSGPGTGWPVVVLLNPGQTVEIVGKSPDGTWWYVKNPVLQGNFCWISAGFATTSGDLGGITVVAIPPTLVVPTSPPAAVVVTDVSVSVNPNTIHVGGCIGPIQPITLNASITTNGAIKLQWHFETDQSGSLPTQGKKFLSAGTLNVSDSFTPPLTAGTYQVQLFIDGMNLKGMDAVASYKITC